MGKILFLKSLEFKPSKSWHVLSTFEQLLPNYYALYLNFSQENEMS